MEIDRTLDETTIKTAVHATQLYEAQKRAGSDMHETALKQFVDFLAQTPEGLETFKRLEMGESSSVR